MLYVPIPLEMARRIRDYLDQAADEIEDHNHCIMATTDDSVIRLLHATSQDLATLIDHHLNDAEYRPD